jgi:hypothetical protein
VKINVTPLNSAHHSWIFATEEIPQIIESFERTFASVMARRHGRVNADALLLIRRLAVLRNRADVRLHICYFQWHTIDPVCGVAGIAA